jgi:predicted AAA+ superfamily ATPase
MADQDAPPLTPRPDAPDAVTAALTRIADALEAALPPAVLPMDLTAAHAFIWQGDNCVLQPVTDVARMDLSLLQGIDRVRDTLLENTRRFADRLPANNALLWGARGMGKSSLVKAAHAEVNAGRDTPLLLVEIHREDIATLPRLMNLLRGHADRQVLIFCDDLSFDQADTSYKSLKAVLEGGIEGRPQNVLFYATSNRRHLMPRDMVDNERQRAINPAEAVEEMVSLSDRFGLWLGFHNCSQDEYLEMIRRYAEHYGLDVPWTDIRAQAIEWTTTRGARSGRVAWQFIQDLAGRLGKHLS